MTAESAPRPVYESLKVIEEANKEDGELYLQFEVWEGEEYEKFQRNLKLFSQALGPQFRCPGIVVRRW